MIVNEVRTLEYIVQTQNLSKHFGKEQAVSNMNLQIQKVKYTDF